MVLSSRQQSAMCSICPARIVLEDCHIICKERFIRVYRLDEDGDLQDEGGAQAFGLGVKSSLL